MRHKDFTGSRCAGTEPIEESALVGVSRKAVELNDFGFDRNIGAVDLDLTRTGCKGISPSAGCLETRQQDRIPAMGCQRLQMVEHASASRHAARRDDDHRATAPIQLSRLVW